jgi:hypothetical protein
MSEEENINNSNLNKINSFISLNNNNILNNFGFGENFFESLKLFNLSEKNLINSSINNNINNNNKTNYKSAFRIFSVSTAETSMLSQKSLSKIPNKNEMLDLYQEDEAEYIPLDNNENKFINKYEDDNNNNNNINNFNSFKLNLNEIIGNNNINNINNNCINNNNNFDNNLFNNNNNINNNFFNIIDNNNNNKNIIKAYKSKHKIKYSKIYEKNSELNKQQNKYKMFHKCNFPNCGRTFSSSGWLKSHFNEHLKLIKKNKFNILFEKYISKKTK